MSIYKYRIKYDKYRDTYIPEYGFGDSFTPIEKEGWNGFGLYGYQDKIVAINRIKEHIKELADDRYSYEDYIDD